VTFNRDRALYDMLSALLLLRSGRAQGAAERLEMAIREAGGVLPTGPVIEGPKPAPQPELASWMRPGA
jgi:hypothetical protein